MNLQLQPHFTAGNRPNLIAAVMDGRQNICGNVESTTTPVLTTTEPMEGGCSDVVNVVTTDTAQHTTDMSIHLTPAKDIQSWVVELTFAAAVDSIQSVLADVTGGGTGWQLANKSWDGAIDAGETLELIFSVQHLASTVCPSIVGVSFNGTNICMGKPFQRQ